MTAGRATAMGRVAPMLQSRIISLYLGRSVTLSDMPLHRPAIVQSVEDRQPNDAIARRLRELGFVAGEEVVVLALGPVGRDPLLVQVGYTRFALRRSEAERVRVAALEAA